MDAIDTNDARRRDRRAAQTSFVVRSGVLPRVVRSAKARLGQGD